MFGGTIGSIVLKQDIRRRFLCSLVGFLSEYGTPRAISNGYREVTGLQVVGTRDDIGSIALGSKNLGYAIILLPGESMDHPEKV